MKKVAWSWLNLVKLDGIKIVRAQPTCIWFPAIVWVWLNVWFHTFTYPVTHTMWDGFKENCNPVATHTLYISWWWRFVMMRNNHNISGWWQVTFVQILNSEGIKLCPVASRPLTPRTFDLWRLLPFFVSDTRTYGTIMIPFHLQRMCKNVTSWPLKFFLLFQS